MNFDEDVVPEFANLKSESLELENENITRSANEEQMYLFKSFSLRSNYIKKGQ